MSSSVVVMGVSGSGKSTFGLALARRLGLEFVDADALHPAANRRKMAAGIPLDDADRAPWLDAVAEVLADGPVVVACSALRRRYRERLRQAAPDLALVLLEGSRDLLAARLEARIHEFMSPTLLDSQLDTLERPGPDEHPIVLDIAHPLDDLIANTVVELEQPR